MLVTIADKQGIMGCDLAEQTTHSEIKCILTGRSVDSLTPGCQTPGPSFIAELLVNC